MQDFNSILSAAQSLTTGERLKLIDALWESVPPEEEMPLTDEWAREIGRRVSEIDQGKAKLIPWDEIRSKALSRIKDASHD